MRKLAIFTKTSFIFYMSMIMCIGLWSCSDDDPVDMPPTITSISPTSGMIGEEITITGTNFASEAIINLVNFNGTVAIPNAATSTELTVNVPDGATIGAGDVTVIVHGLKSAVAPFTVEKGVSTLKIPIINGEDDAEELNGAFQGDPDGLVDLTSSDLELCTEDDDLIQWIGLIFRDVQIPAGATILSAYIQFTCDDDDNQEGPLPINIWGIKEANTSAPFIEELFNVSGRPSTSATVTWNAPIWATKEERGPDQATADLTAIVQEIVDLAGWDSGNNMGFKFTNDETAKIHREAEAWDEKEGVANEDGPAGPPELVISFLEPN